MRRPHPLGGLAVARDDELELVLPFAEVLLHLVDQLEVLLVRMLLGAAMLQQQHLVGQQRPGVAVLFVNEAVGADAVEPEAGGDEDQQAGPEQEAALPFEARFPEHGFDGAIGHGPLILRRLPHRRQRNAAGPRLQHVQWIDVGHPLDVLGGSQPRGRLADGRP